MQSVLAPRASVALTATAAPRPLLLRPLPRPAKVHAKRPTLLLPLVTLKRLGNAPMGNVPVLRASAALVAFAAIRREVLLQLNALDVLGLPTPVRVARSVRTGNVLARRANVMLTANAARRQHARLPLHAPGVGMLVRPM
ncbi:hypothetical protein D9613_007430 [Agrocybe pediades]|uniref:Uncharacterized protein n=1 Tax=Agrocybe pediades TaxID=84607 RepID=A0A8H4QMX1_9AGAR|nr:hypothetical protein D9613_007430 [Agrocybe pediades]